MSSPSSLRKIQFSRTERGFAVLLLCTLLLNAVLSRAQGSEQQGRSIGRVSQHGNLIAIELNKDALGNAKLFDLSGRTLRFRPEGAGYRIQNVSLHWDAEFGDEYSGSVVNLRKFAFPFSQRSWNSFAVGISGSIRFGVTEKDIGMNPYGQRDGGIILDRFDQLSTVAPKLSERAPAICVFLKPRLYGPHYVKEAPDRVVITWELTEPFGGLLDFSWFKTINQFQAVLYRGGSIEMSYKQVSARDAIVGVYPVLPAGQKASAVHFSSKTRKEGPFPAVYEAFHYLQVPRPQDLSCTVIQALGDKFDFLAYYSDFRMDSQEASPPSDGPIGGNVRGIGDTQQEQMPEHLASRCTQGRFQLGFEHPVYVGANEMKAGPPPDAPSESAHSITYYSRQLAEAAPDGKAAPYNYAIGHLGHEVGHRWGAYVKAQVNGEPISLGPWPHWDPGLETRVAYPYSLPTEASTLGGGAWEDNYDGTYTQLRDAFFVPAEGYSYLDLYLMGLISESEVPDFFLLKKLARAANDADGHAIFKAERIKVSIHDVIAGNGPRLPDVGHSQRVFNTGIVVVVEHGKIPSRELLEQAEGIRQQWMKYWSVVTGRRAVMTTNPR